MIQYGIKNAPDETKCSIESDCEPFEARSVLTASVLVANVGKAPDITQIHRESDDREQKFNFLIPCFAGPLRCYRHDGDALQSRQMFFNQSMDSGHPRPAGNIYFFDFFELVAGL